MVGNFYFGFYLTNDGQETLFYCFIFANVLPRGVQFKSKENANIQIKIKIYYPLFPILF